MKLFKYLKQFIFPILIMILLFVIRAGSELQLPTYTSDIVNIGIQQNGIKNSVPIQLSEKTYYESQIFMTDDEIELLKNSFYKDSDFYKLKKLSEEDYNKLNNTFKEVFTMLYGFNDDHVKNILVNNIKNNDYSHQDKFLQLRTEELEKLSINKENITKQLSVNYLKSEYSKIGINLDNIRNSYLKDIGFMMLIFSFIAVLVSIMTSFISSRISSTVGKNLRESVYKKVLSFSKEDIDKFSTASLITRSTNDIQQVQTTLNMALFMALYSPIMAIWGIYKVLQTEASMSWVIALGIIILSIVMGGIMYVVMPKFKIMQKLIDNINLVSREILTGLSVIRIFGREEYQKDKFDKVNKDLRNNQMFTNKAMAFMMPAINLIMNALTVLIVWVGAKSVDAGDIQVGDMMAFLTYAIQIVMSFLMLTFLATMLPRATVAADRIDEILNYEASIFDNEKLEDKKLSEVVGNITFEDVSFTFDGASEPVLRNISFTAKSGETTAIIGSTGSGKSTLINLIPRYFDVTKGSIKIDGVDIRKLSLSKLRDLLGFVPQKGILFKGDIKSNIKFGNENITEDNLILAANISQSTEFINSKEEKFDSAISQGGSNVSGGQKQRLSIARAIAKNPKILLFDDSFSALDYKTDVALRKSLKENMQNTTTIIVAQRISTIINAEQIIVMNEGEIVGIGKHEDLLKNCSTYKEIAKSQLSEEELKKGGVEIE